MVRDIMDFSDEERLTKIIKSFSGFSRFWTVSYDVNNCKYYETHIRIKSAKELLNLVKLYGTLDNVETHFSIGIYNEDNSRIGWTMVFDIDQRGCLECKHYKLSLIGCPYFIQGNTIECLKLKPYDAKEARIKLCSLLKDFDVFFLVDSRDHVWIPDWETSLVKNWNDLCNSESASKIVSYIEKILGFEALNVKIDKSKFSSGRQLIRSMFSYHSSSKTFQVFTNYLLNSELSKDEEIDYQLSLWDGFLLDKKFIEYGKSAVVSKLDTTYKYAENFRKFIETALKSGEEINFVLRAYIEKGFSGEKRKVRLCLKDVPSTASHFQRVVLLFEYLNCGFSDDEIVDKFRNVFNFNEDKVRYHIEKARGKYKRYGCDTLINLGLCLKKLCPIYGKKVTVS